MTPLPTRRSVGSCGRNQGRRGFTLIESAIVTVITGFGVVGMLQLLAAGTLANSEGTELTMAINLANNVREMAVGMPFYDPQDPHTGKVHPITGLMDPKLWDTKEASVKEYDNVLDLDDCEFSPPLDVRRDPNNNYADWKQVVRVETVAHDYLASVRPDTTLEPTVRLTVTILRNGCDVYTTSSLVAAPKLD
jgi:hypothetical protein